MKTYILDIVKEVNQFSEKIDVYTALCNKPWIAFNANGIKEVLIFQSNGTLLITSNGIGVSSSWQWITANKSLLIKQENNFIMFRVEYVNSIIIALNVDGTSEYAFLIEENNNQKFAPQSIMDLYQYFLQIRNTESFLKSRRDFVTQSQNHYQDPWVRVYDITKTPTSYRVSIVIYAIIIIIWLSFVRLYSISLPNNNNDVIVIFILLLLLAAFVLIGISYFISKYRKIKREKAEKYIKEHPEDSINELLKSYL